MTDRKLLKNLTNLSHKFEQWYIVLFECGRNHFSENEFNEDLYIKMQKVLGEILELFIISCKFKDQWNSFQTYPTPFSNNVVTKSQKIGVEIQFGVSFSQLCKGQVFYLESSIVTPPNIRRMDDNFWNKFLSLSSIGNFKFVENSSPKIEKKFVNKKSNLFRLIRNFMLFSVYEPSHTEDYDYDCVVDIGFLEITWDIDTKWEDLIKKAYEAFVIFYSLNNMLYKSEQ